MELYFQIAELIALGGFVWWFRGWNVMVELKVDSLENRVENLESSEQERTDKELKIDMEKLVEATAAAVAEAQDDTGGDDC